MGFIVQLPCNPIQLRLQLVAEELAEFIQLDKIISQRQKGFYQSVKEEIQEIEMLKDLKNGLHGLDLTGEADEGMRENEAEKRVQVNLDLVAKVCHFPPPFIRRSALGSVEKGIGQFTSRKASRLDPSKDPESSRNRELAASQGKGDRKRNGSPRLYLCFPQGQPY